MADSTRIPFCSARRASQPTSASNDALSSRTRSPPGPEGALELRLAAPSAEALDHIGQSLRSIGWQADLTSGNAAGSGYEGRMVIKGAGRSP